MDLQGLVNAMGDMAKQERSNYHITLGELISALEGASDKNLPVLISHDPSKSVTMPHSYRGYYSDLSIEPSNEITTVEGLLDELSEVHNKELTGWKGGEYLMSDSVPIWISEEGTNSGNAVIDVMHNEKNVTLITKLID